MAPSAGGEAVRHRPPWAVGVSPEAAAAAVAAALGAEPAAAEEVGQEEEEEEDDDEAGPVSASVQWWTAEALQHIARSALPMQAPPSPKRRRWSDQGSATEEYTISEPGGAATAAAVDEPASPVTPSGAQAPAMFAAVLEAAAAAVTAAAAADPAVAAATTAVAGATPATPAGATAKRAPEAATVAATGKSSERTAHSAAPWHTAPPAHSAVPAEASPQWTEEDYRQWRERWGGVAGQSGSDASASQWPAARPAEAPGKGKGTGAAPSSGPGDAAGSGKGKGLASGFGAQGPMPRPGSGKGGSGIAPGGRPLPVADNPFSREARQAVARSGPYFVAEGHVFGFKLWVGDISAPSQSAVNSTVEQWLRDGQCLPDDCNITPSKGDRPFQWWGVITWVDAEQCERAYHTLRQCRTRVPGGELQAVTVKYYAGRGVPL